jgi:hypothetical protein
VFVNCVEKVIDAVKGKVSTDYYIVRCPHPAFAVGLTHTCSTALTDLTQRTSPWTECERNNLNKKSGIAIEVVQFCGILRHIIGIRMLICYSF